MWLTGYSQEGLAHALKSEANFEAFLAEAPATNPVRKGINGVSCGVRVGEIEDPVMREDHYMDKLIDELARGKKVEKTLRASDEWAASRVMTVLK